MFNPIAKRNSLNEKIAELTRELDVANQSPQDYELTLARMERLHKLKDNQSKRRVTPDTVVLSAVNLATIAAIIRHEQFNVITSKAFGFVTKLK